MALNGFRNFVYKSKMSVNCAILLLFAIMAASSYAEKNDNQRFVVTPTNTTVKLGKVALFFCRVENRAGSVQFTKDGMTLGYAQNIPGYGNRLKVLKNDNTGDYTLTITNVHPEDQGKYECQVSPLGRHKAIRASAYLKIIETVSSAEEDTSKVDQSSLDDEMKMETRFRNDEYSRGKEQTFPSISKKNDSFTVSKADEMAGILTSQEYNDANKANSTEKELNSSSISNNNDSLTVSNVDEMAGILTSQEYNDANKGNSKEIKVQCTVLIGDVVAYAVIFSAVCLIITLIAYMMHDYGCCKKLCPCISSF